MRATAFPGPAPAADGRRLPEHSLARDDRGGPHPERATAASTPSAASIGGLDRILRRGDRVFLGDRRRRRNRRVLASSGAASDAGSAGLRAHAGRRRRRRCPVRWSSRPIPGSRRPSPCRRCTACSFGATHLGGHGRPGRLSRRRRRAGGRRACSGPSPRSSDGGDDRWRAAPLYRAAGPLASSPRWRRSAAIGDRS